MNRLAAGITCIMLLSTGLIADDRPPIDSASLKKAIAKYQESEELINKGNESRGTRLKKEADAILRSVFKKGRVITANDEYPFIKPDINDAYHFTLVVDRDSDIKVEFEFCPGDDKEKNPDVTLYPQVKKYENLKPGPFTGKIQLPTRDFVSGNYQYLGNGRFAAACKLLSSNTSAIKWAIEPNFTAVAEFSEGLCAVSTDKDKAKWGFIDKDGRMVIKPAFDGSIASGHPFAEGLVAFYDDGKYGFMDKTGKVIIAPQYDSGIPMYFSNGVALCKKGKKTMLIDKAGTVITKDYCYPVPAQSFGERLIPATFKNGVTGGSSTGYGFINTKGELAFETQKFDNVTYFSEGLCAVYINGKYGYIDKKGVMAIQPEYEFAGPFTSGVAVVKSGGLFGIIDKKGKFVLKPTYENPITFSEGLAAVRINDKWGYIDTRGKIVIEA
ncbi:MAG TPA: WG repeat-containing protein, partial [Spirochaetota bacterium]|nr:WG repeat-containing protein [Spirochaetota bacterium]